MLSPCVPVGSLRLCMACPEDRKVVFDANVRRKSPTPRYSPAQTGSFGRAVFRTSHC